MRIALLSRKPTLYSTARLVEAGRARGHEVDVIDPIRCVLQIARGSHRMIFAGHEVGGYDVVIPRIGASITDYGLAVLGFFERHGIPSVNSGPAIARARDKLRALQSLSAHDVGIPRTVMMREPSAVRAAVDAVGGTPVIIKLLQGTQGVGVMIAESPESVESTLDTLWGLGQNIILQEFIAESRGRDLRALVVGGKLVAAMRRTARAGEFRSNLHRGGAGKRIELDEAAAKCAVDAASIIGLDVAGVDMLESKQGPRVIEVNSSPGLRGIERSSGVDVAARVIEHAERLSRVIVANPARLVEPGTAGEVPLGRDLRAWVVRGAEPGPIVWAWAPGGDSDPSMAQALGELRDQLSPASLSGSVGLLIDGPAPPIYAGKPLGTASRQAPRLAPLGSPIKEQYPWAAMVRAICDGSDAIVLCTSLPAGFEATPHATLDLTDRRARKVARWLGAPFVLAPVVTPRLDGNLLSAPTVSWIDGEADRLSRPVVTRAVAALRSLLSSLGMTDDAPEEPPVRVVLKSIVTVDAPGSGMVEPAVAPGGLLKAGEPAAWFGEPGLRARRALLSPATGVVLFVRSGRVPFGPVMGIGKLRRSLPKVVSARSANVMEVGWCERVQLPELGVRLKAKIDTGARTSALHVTSIKRLGPALIEIELPAGRGKSVRARVEVREWTLVRDSGGHAERRPVVETLLRLGTLERRVRVSLTDRGDMRFPMLVGRTALTSEVRVQPTRRFLT